jgi:hypothetical protein
MPRGDPGSGATVWGNTHPVLQANGVLGLEERFEIAELWASFFGMMHMVAHSANVESRSSARRMLT